MTDREPPHLVTPKVDESWYRQEDLSDAAFYNAHRDSIRAAIRAGRIIPRTEWMTTGAPTPDQRREAARKAAR